MMIRMVEMLEGRSKMEVVMWTKERRLMRMVITITIIITNTNYTDQPFCR